MMHKAQTNGQVSFSQINLRDYGLGPRKQVDDIPYGGGDACCYVQNRCFEAIEHAKQIDRRLKCT